MPNKYLIQITNIDSINDIATFQVIDSSNINISNNLGRQDRNLNLQSFLSVDSAYGIQNDNFLNTPKTNIPVNLGFNKLSGFNKYLSLNGLFFSNGSYCDLIINKPNSLSSPTLSGIIPLGTLASLKVTKTSINGKSIYSLNNKSPKEPIPYSPGPLNPSEIFDLASPPSQPKLTPVRLNTDSKFTDLDYIRIGFVEMSTPASNITVRKELKVLSSEILRGTGSIKEVDRLSSNMVSIKLRFTSTKEINKKLIPLINQIKRAPFLPVENNVLLEMGIVALAILDMSITTVPQFPNMLDVDISAEPFDPTHYLNTTDLIFNDTFCWPIFKIWCDRRSTCIPVDNKFSGKFTLSLPNENKLKEKLDVNKFVIDILSASQGDTRLNQNIVINPVEVSAGNLSLEKDYGVATEALANMNAAKSLDSSSVKTYKRDGQKFAAIKIYNTTNYIVALRIARLHEGKSDSDNIRIYKNVSFNNKNNTNNLIMSGTLVPTTSQEYKDLMKALLDKTSIGNFLGSTTNNLLTSYWIEVPENSIYWDFAKKKRDRKGIVNLGESGDFTEIDLGGNITVTDVNVTLTNKISTNVFQQGDSMYHQCLGIGDTIATVVGLAQGLDSVNKLRSAVSGVVKLAQFFRTRPFGADYFGFIRVNNEILNACGIKDAIPYGLTVSTVEGYPDVYSFTLQLIQFRQDQGTKEQFERLEDIIIQYGDTHDLNAGIKNYTQVGFKTIFDINKDQADAANKLFTISLGTDKFNPLTSSKYDAVQQRITRSLYTKTALRLKELYPDLELPTKSELNYWINLLQYYNNNSNDLNKIKLGTNKDIINIALDGIDIDDFNRNVQSWSATTDLLGYADPDFYCIPSEFSPQENLKSVVDSIIGNEKKDGPLGGPGTIAVLTDRFGGKIAQNGIKRDQPSQDNQPDIIEKEDIEFYNNQKKKLDEYTEYVSSQSNGKLIKQDFGKIPLNAPISQGGDVSPDFGLLDPGVKVHKISPKPQQIPQPALSHSAYNPEKLLDKNGVKAHSSSLSKIPREFISNITSLLAYAKNNPEIFKFVSLKNKGNISNIISEIKPELVYSIIALESDVRNLDQNSSGAIGYMQILPGTALGALEAIDRSGIGGLLRPANINNISEYLKDPRSNVTIGTLYLMECFLSNMGAKTPEERLIKSIMMYKSGGYFSQTVWDNMNDHNYPFKSNEEYFKTDKTKTKYLSALQYGLAVLELMDFQLAKNTEKHQIAHQSTSYGKKTLSDVDANSTIPTLPILEKKEESPITPYFNSMFDVFKEKKIPGRLLACFPTYFISIIDGGAYLGIETVFDHFYEKFGVVDISLTSNRKSPTDVATVTLSNMYGRLSAAFNDIEAQKANDPRASWTMESMISYGEQILSGLSQPDLEARRKQFFDSVMLKPGARLHIRIGFGSDTSQLPIKFNGVITEIPTQDSQIEIVALGDGYELEKPMNQDYTDASFANLADRDPRAMIMSLFGPSQQFLSQLTEGFVGANNPWGISHFGQMEFTESYNTEGASLTSDALLTGIGIVGGGTLAGAGLGSVLGLPGIVVGGLIGGAVTFVGSQLYNGPNLSPITRNPEGDMGVNVYSPTANGIPSIYEDLTVQSLDYMGFYRNWVEGRTVFGLQVDGASPWKVIQACRSGVPNFIAAVRPFEFRSTLFYGKHYYPYHYMYKQFYTQQERDTITANQAAANTYISRVGTNLGLASGTTEDLQKLMEKRAFSQFHLISTGINLFSTNIIADSSNVYSNCIANFTWSNIINHTSERPSDLVYADWNIHPEVQRTKLINSGIRTGTWSNASGFRPMVQPDSINCAAAVYIRDSVADMYQGYAMIPGDPDIFTWDYCYLHDANNQMNGLFQVKEVQNHFSLDFGYTTLVSPDCIVFETSSFDHVLTGSIATAGKNIVNVLIMQKILSSIKQKTAVAGAVGLARVLLNVPIGVRNIVSNKIASIDKLVTKLSESDVTLSVKGLQVKNGPKASLDTLKAIQQKLTEIVQLGGEKTVPVVLNWYTKLLERTHVFADSQAGKTTLFTDIASKGVKGARISKSIIDTVTNSIKDNRTVTRKAASELINDINKVLNSNVKFGLQAVKGEKYVVEVINEGGTIPKVVEATRISFVRSTLESAETEVIASAGLGLETGGISLILQAAFGLLLFGVAQYVNRIADTHHAVTAQPLLIGGKEFSAGINGHMGMVKGDPISFSDNFWYFLLSSKYAEEKGGVFGNIYGHLLELIDFTILPGINKDRTTDNEVALPQSNPFLVPRSETEYNRFIDSQMPDSNNHSSNNYSSNTAANSTPNIDTKSHVIATGGKKEIQKVPTDNLVLLHSGTNANTKIVAALYDDITTVAKKLGYILGITSVNDGTHVPNSRHYSSEAVDIATINGLDVKSKDGKLLGDVLAATLVNDYGYVISPIESIHRKAIIWQSKDHFNHLHISYNPDVK